MQPRSNALPLQTTQDQTRGIRMIAGSLFRELIAHGYSKSQIIDLTSELLEQLMGSMRGTGEEASGCVVSTLRPHRETP